MPKFIQITPAYPTNISKSTHVIGLVSAEAKLTSALITSCFTWPLFLWLITGWFQLALALLSLRVTCTHTRKSHDANCDACKWRRSWTIHLTRRLTFSGRCMEICTNRSRLDHCLFSRLVGNTQGCCCVRLHHAVNENLDPGWKWAVVCTIQPFYSLRAKSLLDGYHYCINIREVPGSIPNFTGRLYLLKERCSFLSVMQLQSKRWRPSLQLSFVFYYYITVIRNMFRSNYKKPSSG